MSSTPAGTLPTVAQRWWQVRRPFAVAPLFVLFYLIGWMVPGLAAGLILALVGRPGEESDWRGGLIVSGFAIAYTGWFGLCARILYSSLKARPIKYLRAMIWGGMCFGALPIPLMVVIVMIMNLFAVIANLFFAGQ